jgi:hypothetical protein
MSMAGAPVGRVEVDAARLLLAASRIAIDYSNAISVEHAAVQ